jgi:hypothetical protein
MILVVVALFGLFGSFKQFLDWRVLMLDLAVNNFNSDFRFRRMKSERGKEVHIL